MKNKGAAGIDGISTQELPNYLEANWLEIKAKIEIGKYKPSSVRKVEIPKDDGSKRMLGIPTESNGDILGTFSIKISLLHGGRNLPLTLSEGEGQRQRLF